MTLEEFVARQSAWMGKLVERCSGMRMTISGPPAAGSAAPWKKKRRGTGKGKATGTGEKATASPPRKTRRKATSTRST
ncbi:hypothetical protein D3C71_1739570 [compost metagenome]